MMELPNGVISGLHFSQNYLRPKHAVKESKRFRVKIAQNFANMVGAEWTDCEAFIERDVGIQLGFGYLSQFKDWFIEADIVEVLDAITSIWKFFNTRQRIAAPTGYVRGEVYAKKWHVFVSNAFASESMGFQLDDQCGVHFFVDLTFEQVRFSAVDGLGATRYSNARHSLEKAYQFLDGDSPDAKSAVRSAFESLEILAKLIVPEAQNLNSKMIEIKLKPIVLQTCVDEAHKNMASAILESLKEFVNGVHYYRHGQGEENIVEPPIDVAVYILSQISNAIRYLIPVDQRLQSAS